MASSNTTQVDEPPHHLLDVNYAFAVVAMTCLAVAGTSGTFGNLLIIASVILFKEMHNVDSVFIVNLAFCDLYITLIAEPLSIVAKALGNQFFESVPGLCRSVGCLCTISCVGSLMTLSTMSCNRYILICHNHLYRRIFTLRNCLLMCAGIYLFGFFLVSLNFYGVGNHAFDHKSYECVWDRMASHDYTIVFGIVLVWIPIFVTGFAYSRTYLYVRRAKIKVHSHSSKASSRNKTTSTGTRSLVMQEGNVASSAQTDCGIANDGGDERPDGDGCVQRKKDNEMPADSTIKGPRNPGSSVSGARVLPNMASLKLAKTLFIIYVVFSTCWIPYSAVIILDRQDSFPHELHAFVIVFAHLNASINWLVYYCTHSKLRWAFRKLLGVKKVTTPGRAKSNTVFTLS